MLLFCGMIASAPRSSHAIRINADHDLDHFPALFALLRPALTHLLGDVGQSLPVRPFIPQATILVRDPGQSVEHLGVFLQLRDALGFERKPFSQRPFRATRPRRLYCKNRRFR